MWYHAFIAHLATIAAPLFTLTSVKRNFQWNEAATQAVLTLQHLVTNAPCLARWDRELPARVVTDVSKIGIGSVLEQKHSEGWRPISFWSRKLRDPETRYSTTDREWLAVVESVSIKWRGFLEDRSFTVCSDHMALDRKLHKSAHDPPVTDRKCRWIERLMPFSLKFEYIKGENNVVADALSRCPLVANSITVVRSMLAGLMVRMKIAAEHDGGYAELKTKADSPDNSLRLLDGLVIDENDVVYIPEDDSLRTFLISEAHDSTIGNHFGEERTLEMMKRHWQWRGMATDVTDYVRSCVKCQKTKHDTRRTPGLLHPILAEYPWHIVTLDFVSKFAPAARTNNNQCLVIVDKFSKYTFLEACYTTIDAKETARIFVKRVVAPFGVPKVVISDRGPQFSSSVWKEILGTLGTRVALASTHHPQTDGQSERAIQTLLRLVRAFASEQQELWEDLLPTFELSLNHAQSKATKHSPFQILFGRSPRTPIDFARENLTQAINEANDISTPSASQWAAKWDQARRKLWDFIRRNQLKVAKDMKRRYDRGRKPLHLEPGDMVLLSTQSHAILTGIRKHREKYVGPYIVDSRIHDNAYSLRGLPPGVPTTQNVCFLRLFLPSPARFASRPNPEYAQPIEVDGQVEWEVEAIVAHRVQQGVYRYQVRWKDMPLRQWLSEANLENCKELLREYHHDHQLPLIPFLSASSSNHEQESSEEESETEEVPSTDHPTDSLTSDMTLGQSNEAPHCDPEEPSDTLVTVEIPSLTDSPTLLTIAEFPSSPTPPSPTPAPLDPPPTPIDSRLRRRLRRELVRKVDASGETFKEDSALGMQKTEEAAKIRKKTPLQRSPSPAPHSIPPPLSTRHSRSTPSDILSDHPLDWLFWDHTQSSPSPLSSSSSEPTIGSAPSCPTPSEEQEIPPPGGIS